MVSKLHKTIHLMALPALHVIQVHFLSLTHYVQYPHHTLEPITMSLSVRRPSGVPEQDLCSFLMPYYQKQEAYMKLELKKIREENAALAQKVQAGRERIAETENCIAMAVDQWKVTEKLNLERKLCQKMYDCIMYFLHSLKRT